MGPEYDIGKLTKGTNPKDLVGVKKSPLRLVPPALQIIAAPAMAEGNEKYGPYNWRSNKVQFSIYLEAIERHLAALRDREDVDPKSGLPHLSHIAANVAIIADALYGGNLIDDRPEPGPAGKMLSEQDKTEGPLTPEPGPEPGPAIRYRVSGVGGPLTPYLRPCNMQVLGPQSTNRRGTTYFGENSTGSGKSTHTAR